MSPVTFPTVSRIPPIVELRVALTLLGSAIVIVLEWVELTWESACDSVGVG